MYTKEQYHIVSPSFWTDPEILNLNESQKLFMLCALTNLETVTKVKFSGILEISRATFTNFLGYDLKKVNDTLEFFNFKTNLMSYDFDKHVLFIKNLIKYTARYRHKVSNLKNEYLKTFEKVPKFWCEFVERHHDNILTLSLTDEGIKESELFHHGKKGLFNLKNQELPSPILKPLDYKMLTKKKEKHK